MKSYNCPHCGNPTITWARKMCLGPALPATCSNCNGKVGVPYTTSLLAGIPMFVGFAALTSGVVLPLIAGTAITVVLYTIWVPLEKR